MQCIAEKSLVLNTITWNYLAQMKTSLILGIMATTLAVAGAIAPAALALTQTATPTNTNDNTQTNTQTSDQTANALTVAANVNLPSATIDNSGDNSLNLGVVSQDAHQHADASTQQDQQSVQKAANVNFSVQNNSVRQTAVCAVINDCSS